jgi:hypothetical protein
MLQGYLDDDQDQPGEQEQSTTRNIGLVGTTGPPHVRHSHGLRLNGRYSTRQAARGADSTSGGSAHVVVLLQRHLGQGGEHLVEGDDPFGRRR